MTFHRFFMVAAKAVDVNNVVDILLCMDAVFSSHLPQEVAVVPFGMEKLI